MDDVPTDVSKDWNWLRGELDIFCSAFLSRGGWGNYGDFPRSILYVLAEEAADRGDGSWGQDAYEYVYRVLSRAKRATADVETAADEVRSVFDAIHGLRAFGVRGREYLNHWRDLERHVATDPISDPRWASPVRHLTFEHGEQITEAWVYASDDELENAGVKIPSRAPNGNHVPMMHRMDGPALLIRNARGPVEELWVRYGRLHRENGPAHVWHPDMEHGVKGHRRWYVNGIQKFQED